MEELKSIKTSVQNLDSKLEGVLTRFGKLESEVGKLEAVSTKVTRGLNEAATKLTRGQEDILTKIDDVLAEFGVPEVDAAA